jgi:cell division protein FtsX
VKLGWILRSVCQQARAHRRIVVVAAVAFCLLAVVVGVARLGVRTVERWGAFVGQNVHVIVYLSDDADPEMVQGLTGLLGRVPTVVGVKAVEPAQALARLRAVSTSLGAGPKALEGLEPGYFPRSIEVSLMPAADLSERAADLARRLRGVPGVDQVDAMTSGLDRLAGWVKLGRRLGITLLVACGLCSLAILSVVFMRSRSAGRTRAAVLLQLGETDTGVRLPASLWMAAAALLGGAAGALIVGVGWRPLLAKLERSLGIAVATPLPFFSGRELVGGLAIAFLLGLGLGFFATPLPRVDGHA